MNIRMLARAAMIALFTSPAFAEIPDPMLGTWDRTQAECAGDPTMARLTVRPDRLSFAWGYADIAGIELHGDVLFLRGAVHQEGLETPAANEGYFRLDLIDPTHLRLTRKDIEVVNLVRCPDQQAASLDSGVRGDGADLALTPLTAGTWTRRDGATAFDAPDAGPLMRVGCDPAYREVILTRPGTLGRNEQARLRIATPGGSAQGYWNAYDTAPGEIEAHLARDDPALMLLLTAERVAIGGDGMATLVLPVDTTLRDTLTACAGSEAGDARSHYTTLDLAQCELLEVFQEGSGSRMRCSGWNGTPLYVSEGDLRFDVDVGREDDDFIAVSPFNRLGDTVEWRTGPDGALQAVILRYRYDTEPAIPSDLAVISAPTDTRDSCYLAFVAPDAQPSQNEAARTVADRADSLPCIDAR